MLAKRWCDQLPCCPLATKKCFATVRASNRANYHIACRELLASALARLVHNHIFCLRALLYLYYRVRVSSNFALLREGSNGTEKRRRNSASVQMGRTSEIVNSRTHSGTVPGIIAAPAARVSDIALKRRSRSSNRIMSLVSVFGFPVAPRSQASASGGSVSVRSLDPNVP